MSGNQELLDRLKYLSNRIEDRIYRLEQLGVKSNSDFEKMENSEIGQDDLQTEQLEYGEKLGDSILELSDVVMEQVEPEKIIDSNGDVKELKELMKAMNTRIDGLKVSVDELKEIIEEEYTDEEEEEEVVVAKPTVPIVETKKQEETNHDNELRVIIIMLAIVGFLVTAWVSGFFCDCYEKKCPVLMTIQDGEF